MSRYPRTAEKMPGAEVSRLTPDAFADAFTACSRALWCIAAGVLGTAEQAEDVLQEGAMIALGKLDQFDADTSFLAWMGKIVRFVALNHARRRQRAPMSAVDPDVLAATAEAPSSRPATPMDSRGDLTLDQTSFDDGVTAALRELETSARQCVLLRTLLQMPYKEIAMALDIPEGTAMSHVHRARHALRNRLRERDADAVTEGPSGT